MKATLALFIVGLAVVSAWKLPNWITHQDAQEIQANEQKFIDAQKSDFKTAAGNNNKAKMSELSINLLNSVKAAKELSDKALPGILKITKTLKEKAEKLESSWLQREMVTFITHAVDGNRENKIYYKLDASQTWIADREGDIKDQGTKNKFGDAKKAIIAARDALDKQAQVFAKNIKAIKEMTNWTGDATKNNAQQIKTKVAEIEKANQDSQFVPLTEAAIKKTQELTAL